MYIKNSQGIVPSYLIISQQQVSYLLTYRLLLLSILLLLMEITFLLYMLLSFPLLQYLLIHQMLHLIYLYHIFFGKQLDHTHYHSSTLSFEIFFRGQTISSSQFPKSLALRFKGFSPTYICKPYSCCGISPPMGWSLEVSLFRTSMLIIHLQVLRI